MYCLTHLLSICSCTNSCQVTFIGAYFVLGAGRQEKEFMIYLGQEQVHRNGHLGQKMMRKQLSRSTDIFLPKVTTPPPPTSLSAQTSLSSGTIPFLRLSNTGPCLLTTITILLCVVPWGSVWLPTTLKAA